MTTLQSCPRGHCLSYHPALSATVLAPPLTRLCLVLLLYASLLNWPFKVPGRSVLSRDNLLKLVVFVSIKTGIWFSIPEPVPDWGRAGVAVVLQCDDDEPLHRPLDKVIRIKDYKTSGFR